MICCGLALVTTVLLRLGRIFSLSRLAEMGWVFFAFRTANHDPDDIGKKLSRDVAT